MGVVVLLCRWNEVRPSSSVCFVEPFRGKRETFSLLERLRGPPEDYAAYNYGSLH